jgi:hypothetical protein
LDPAGFRPMLQFSDGPDILGQGLAAGRFVGVQLYNKNCVKCKLGKSHDGLMCSGNYNGSSKGMEANGVEKVILDFF